MPESPNRIRNVCNPEGEFPYCSRSCAEHAYWQRDLPAFLDEFDREMKQNAGTEARVLPSPPVTVRRRIGHDRHTTA